MPLKLWTVNLTKTNCFTDPRPTDDMGSGHKHGAG